MTQVIDHPTNKTRITAAKPLKVLTAFDLCRDYAVYAPGNRDRAKRLEQEGDRFICQAALRIDAPECESNDVRPLRFHKRHLDEATVRALIQVQPARMPGEIGCGRSTGR